VNFWQWVMMTSGVVLLSAGIWSLARLRRGDPQALQPQPDGADTAPAPDVHPAPPEPEPRSPEWSTPSRGAVGIALMLVGYHLVVWTMPPTATNLQVPRSVWWVVPLACVSLVTLSRALDLLETRPRP
jgi:hypothetical protein